MRGRVADGKMVMVDGFFVIFTILKTIDDDDGNTVIELQGCLRLSASDNYKILSGYGMALMLHHHDN